MRLLQICRFREENTRKAHHAKMLIRESINYNLPVITLGGVNLMSVNLGYDKRIRNTFTSMLHHTEMLTENR